MFTIVAWDESQDSAVLVAMAAVADPHVRVSGDDIIVPDALPNILLAYGVGADMTRLQFQSPSLRRLLQLEVVPLRVAATPSGRFELDDMSRNPIPLDADEAMQAHSAEDAAGAARNIALLWFSDGAQTPAVGDIRTVRATASATLVANVWTNAAITLDQTLPAGTYDVVGLFATSTTLVAARLVLVGQTWRPGATGRLSINGEVPPVFRQGRLGVWGTFEHNTPPTIDFLATAADTAEVVYLDLLKVA